MKKFFASIFLCIVILIGVFNWQKMNKGSRMGGIKISWYSDLNIERHDPADIQFAAPAILLMNLYTSLLIYNNKSEIDLGLAESFSWISDSEVKFKFRENLISSKGQPITAEDAFLSFKRLMVKQMNTHGDLQNFLCPSSKIRSMEDDCPGMRFEDNELFLKAADPNLAKFLLPLIANCDFVVIPRAAIDWNSSDLKIIDYANTSGPYFVHSTNVKSEHVLKANKNSPLYSSEMPQTVDIVPILDNSSPKKLIDGDIDMISTIDRARPEEMKKFEKNENFNLHQTSGLEVTKLQFTTRGRSNLTDLERLSLGSFIKKRMASSWTGETAFKETDQFFPTFGEASLSANQLQEIRKLYENSNELPKKIVRISVEGYRLEEFKKLFADHQNIEFVKFTGRPSSKSLEEMEDGYLVPGDTGFIENISLISYYMNTGSFGYDDRKLSNDWIQDYIKTHDKTVRLAKLKQLHFEAIAKGIIVPISITPYFAAAKKQWKLDFHRHFAGTPLWMMRKN